LEFDSLKVYILPVSLTIPVTFLHMDQSSPWNWRIAPFAGIEDELITSGTSIGDLFTTQSEVLWSAGVVNTLDYRINHWLIVSAVDQYSYYQTLTEGTAGEYIDQDILKNGLRLTTPIYPRLLASLYGLRTDFLHAALVKNYYTIGGTLSFLTTRTMTLGLSANTDSGNGYHAWDVGFRGAWRW
jgi:hypothetical protein